jgi:hypothetical protein
VASIARGGVDDAPQGDEGEGKAPASRGQPTYSGRLLLRMPRSLHAELAQRAEREGTSLNQLIIGRLSGSLDEAGSPAPVSGAAEAAGATEATEPEAARRTPRFLTLALALNLVVIVAAGAIAVALLIAAWQGGL